MENLVTLYPNLFRVIEIAKVGNYSISVYFDKDYKNGFQDYKLIKEFCKGWFDNFVSDGDLKVTICNSIYSSISKFNNKVKHDTLEDISIRIEKALKFPIIDKNQLNLSSSSETLFKAAIGKLDLSLSQIEKIKEVAITIARMEFSEVIDVVHLAESISYSYTYSDYNAELDYTRKFGDMIEIKVGELDIESIKSAIDYLTKLIPS